MKPKDCHSRSEAERYLLNRMSPDEETAFQTHLEACETCRACLKELRNLSIILIEKEETTAVRRQLSPWMAAAACILLVVGFSFFWGNYNTRTGQSGEPHDVFINQQQRATIDSVQPAVDSLIILKETK
ncbi:MAG: DUF3379 domain-containing protein [Tannerella sp.]|jgi:hypothetical protein|nr:DUF3379 domain-containing protein [Tannerella sp.]